MSLSVFHSSIVAILSQAEDGDSVSVAKEMLAVALEVCLVHHKPRLRIVEPHALITILVSLYPLCMEKP